MCGRPPFYDLLELSHNGIRKLKSGTHPSPRSAKGNTPPSRLRLHILSQSSFSVNPTSTPGSSSLPLFRIACHLPTCVIGRPGISLRNSVASSLRKNANEHSIGAPEWLTAERHPTLPEEVREERAERRGDKDEMGVLYLWRA